MTSIGMDFKCGVENTAMAKAELGEPISDDEFQQVLDEAVASGRYEVFHFDHLARNIAGQNGDVDLLTLDSRARNVLISAAAFHTIRDFDDREKMNEILNGLVNADGTATGAPYVFSSDRISYYRDRDIVREIAARADAAVEDGAVEDGAVEDGVDYDIVSDEELMLFLDFGKRHSSLSSDQIGNLAAALAHDRLKRDPIQLVGRDRCDFVSFVGGDDSDYADFDTYDTARRVVLCVRNEDGSVKHGYEQDLAFRALRSDTAAPQLDPKLSPRAAIWRAALISPALDAEGPKADFIDTRRPEGRRIMPCSPDGCVVEWVGKTKSMKTGTAIAEGLSAVQQGGRVLYVALEDKSGVARTRLPAACAARKMTLNQLHGRWHTWKQPIDFLNPGDVDVFIETMREFAPTLIFVDVSTLGIGGRSPSDTGIGISLVTALMRIAEAFKATVVTLTHPPGNTTGDNMRAIGSTLQGDLAYGTILFNYDRQTGVQRIHVWKMKNGEADGFDVFMRCQPAPDGTPVMVDVPAVEWDTLASRKGRDAPEPTAEADDLRGKTLAALKALHDAGSLKPQPVPAVVLQIAGEDEKTSTGHSLGVTIRRRMKKGCLADLALRHGRTLSRPLAFRSWADITTTGR